jgi:hypothetical protein
MESIFGGFGPYIAIGRPGDNTKAFGAARVYLDDSVWQQQVSEHISRSRFVVLFLELSEGLLWEIEEVLRQEALNKTLFVLPPQANLFDTVQLLSRFPALAALFASESGSERAIAAFHYQDRPIVFTARNRVAEAYQCLCNYVCKFALKERWLDDADRMSL